MLSKARRKISKVVTRELLKRVHWARHRPRPVSHLVSPVTDLLSPKDFASHVAPQSHGADEALKKVNANRFMDLTLSSQHNPDEDLDEAGCWRMLEEFAETLNRTASKEQFKLINCCARNRY